MTSPDLSNLIERCRKWFRPRRSISAERLFWHVYCAGHPLSADPCAAYRHIAKSRIGTFEIFEDGAYFLLHFPKSKQLPAELFPDLSEAKRAAVIALQSQDTDHD